MITCILASASPENLKDTVSQLQKTGVVRKVMVVGNQQQSLPGVDEWIMGDRITSFAVWQEIASKIDTEFTLLYTKALPLDPGQYALQRMVQVCRDSQAGMVYSDFDEVKEGVRMAHPVIDYQEGSLRDDFDFGSLLLFDSRALKEAISGLHPDTIYSGLYALRLKLSQKARLVHIPEMLYSVIELDIRKSGEKMFDYVDPKNREVQVEMEQACLRHLKEVGAYLKPVFKKVKFDEGDFPVEASVVIPVRNRAKTIGDAIESVLSQQTDFLFNLIIVDNFSTDGTSDLIRSFAERDQRVIHVIPQRNDLGIGGCWNEAIMHPLCGKFAIQLDSDDLYIDTKVIERIVRAFYDQNCAMLVGAYQMVNFKLEEIPPGLIDHKEWTPENGRNNALRINGLGAPRAFYTPVIRSLKVPNVSYGEDYALGLNISRYYQIGRIYEALYLCRRWEENSDASLDIRKLNGHNFYKDKIRTLELWARQQYVKTGQPV